MAAIGITIGASWNGAIAFTATSGPGISLMTEFLGLAYFSEIPMVLSNVQRAGPSTGMPTRTQQSDILSCAYASHGDTKQVLLFPESPTECFEFSALAFDLTEQLQTPIIIMSDLDLGMNDHLTDEFIWDDEKKYKQGKLLSAEQLSEIKHYAVILISTVTVFAIGHYRAPILIRGLFLLGEPLVITWQITAKNLKIMSIICSG